MPFHLHQQMTDDVSRVEEAMNLTGIHSGADAPESLMEALYQLLAGTGYDQGCDGALDGVDVPPFMASPDDAFGGAVAGAMDPSSSGGGSLGGVGFRDGALHLVVYLTDSPIRDPDEGDPSPGGCAFDAGMDNVVAAASALDARIMGVWGGMGMPETEASMDTLAVRTGSVNAEGEAMVFDWGSGSGSSMREAILDMSEDMLVRDFSEFTVAVTSDPYDVVSRIDSDKETGVMMDREPVPVELTVHLNLPSEPGPDPVIHVIEYALSGDGSTALGTGRAVIAVGAAGS